MRETKPRWLNDDPEVLAWLHAVLDRLERQPAEERKEPLRFTVDEKLFPGLFHFGPEADGRWQLIAGLTESLPLKITFRRNRDDFEPEYVGARLALEPSCELKIREWLLRPRITPEAQAWREAVDAAPAAWPAAARARLRERRLHVEGRSPEEVVAGFVQLGSLAGRGLTLRQLSASAFFGDSKFLERHGASLVEALYPKLQPAQRPLVVDVFLPARVEAVLFIENQDTYLRAASRELPGTRGCALVYAAGFKAGAARIREPGGAALHYAGAVDCKPNFEDWWFGRCDRPLPVHFWGDLDFEGMGILRQLHRLFGARAWQPGYEPLLRMLREGRGHLLEAADKQQQKDPEQTGCPYADQTLLPALRRLQSCVDQETFRWWM